MLHKRYIWRVAIRMLSFGIFAALALVEAGVLAMVTGSAGAAGAGAGAGVGATEAEVSDVLPVII